MHGSFRFCPLHPGAVTQDSHKRVLGCLTDEDETHQLLPFPGSAQGLHDQGGMYDVFDAQLARLAPGFQPTRVAGAPSPAGVQLSFGACFPSAASEFSESDGEPDPAQTPWESTVQSTLPAQAALELAARAAAIPVERAPHHLRLAGLAPPSAAVETGGGSGAAARKLSMRPMPAPLGSGGVASTQDAPGGAGGSRSRAMTQAVEFEVQQLGNTVKTLYYLLNNHHYAANEVGSETSKALKRGATLTTAYVCELLCSASKGLRPEWHDALVIPAIPHDDTISRPGSLLYRLAGAVARGFGGNLRPDLLSHKPRASARDTPPDERKALLADAFGCANLPAGCSKVVIVDDNVDTCATGEAMASALKAAAARAGQQLTVCLVCVARCVKVMKRAANAQLPVAVRERLDAALDKDTAAVAPLLTREQRGVVYRSLNYVGSTVRGVYDASWTGEDMLATRAKEHNRRLDKGIHQSPKHMAQALAHRAHHGEWPDFEVLEVLYSKEGEPWDAFVRRVIRAEQRWLDALGDMRSNASATAGRPDTESCVKGGRCGGEDDFRVKDAAVDLQAKEQAHESAQEAACGAPQDKGLQAAAAAAAAALELAQAAHQTALQQQALTLEGKLKGARTGGEDDFRVKDAAVHLQAKELAHESAQEATCGAPQDPGLQAAAAAAAAAVAVARDAYGKAQQQKARTSKGKQTGGNNHRTAKGPNTQKCGGCGELGGQWRSCPRNPESAKRSQPSMHRFPVHDDGPGEPGKRWGKRTKDVYAERLMVASAATAVAAQPQPRGMKRPPPHPQPQKQTHKIANFNGSRLQLAKPLP